VWAALLLPAATLPIGGQWLLLKVPGTEPPPGVQFTTPAAGSEAAVPQTATVNAALTIVFDAAVLDGPQGKTWSAGLAALYARNRKLSFDFAALAPGAAPRVASAASRPQAATALKSLAAGEGAGVGPLPFAALLGYLPECCTVRRGYETAN
jgi:hypothetical protein